MELTPSFSRELESTIQQEIEERGFYWIGKQTGLLVARD